MVIAGLRFIPPGCEIQLVIVTAHDLASAQVGDGYSTRQIAQKLNLSSKTIDSYREHLKLKLNLESGAELVCYAIQWGRNESSA